MAETAFEEKTLPLTTTLAHTPTHIPIHMHMHVHKKYPHELTHMLLVLENSKFMLCAYLTASSFEIRGAGYFCRRKLAPSLSFWGYAFGSKILSSDQLTCPQASICLALAPCHSTKSRVHHVESAEL